MLGHELHPQGPGVATGSVPETAGVAGAERVVLLVDDGRGQLAVVGPGPPVDVVAADGGPDVVADADFGVDVDRRAGEVLDPADSDPVTVRRAHQGQRPGATDEVGRQGEPAVLVGVVRDHGYHAQVGLLAQRRREGLGDLGGPQLLVLEVDQVTRPGEGLGVSTGHRALALRRERVAACAPMVGTQQLHRVGASRLGVGELRWKGRALPGLAAQPVGEPGARDCGVSGCGSSQRRQNRVSTSPTTGPRRATIASCHGGADP